MITVDTNCVVKKGEYVKDSQVYLGFVIGFIIMTIVLIIIGFVA